MDEMKVLITGDRGLLGAAVTKHCMSKGIQVVGTGFNNIDITKEIDIKCLIMNFKPDAVIHCAAFTSVDLAEEDKERCYAVNVLGTRFIAEICKILDIKLIYMSTDYVFGGSGDTPWNIDDNLRPINYYGETKLLGEFEVQKYLKNFFIIRTSWVFGEDGDNFVKKMLQLAENIDINIANSAEHDSIKIVCDQIGSPTYTADLAELICDMLISNKYGIYHASNEGYCSWYEFACEIFRIKCDSLFNILPVKSSDFPSKALRPLNSRLDKSSLLRNGFKTLPNWKYSLKVYLKNINIIEK